MTATEINPEAGPDRAGGRRDGWRLQLFDWLVLGLVNRVMVRRHMPMMARYLGREPRRGRRVSLAVPRCANDKFHWRKVFDRNPDFTRLADKIEAKPWISLIAPVLRIAPMLWHGAEPEKIPNRLLRGDVVLKASHSYKANLFVREGKPGRRAVLRTARQFLARDHGRKTLQWGYFDIPPRLLIEERVGGEAPLHELKYHVFGGRVMRVIHIHDRYGDIASMTYDLDPQTREFVALDLPGFDSPVLKRPLPDSHAAALTAVSRIGKHFDAVRVDLMTDGTNLWFGELTFYSRGGYFGHIGHDPRHPLAQAWDLRDSWFLRTPQRGWRRVYAGALRRALDRQEAAWPPEMGKSGLSGP